MKIAVDTFTPSVIVFGRVIIGAALLIPIALKQGLVREILKGWKYVIPYAFAEMIGPWYLISSAEKNISSGLAGLLVATVPIWATIFASINGDKTVWHSTRLFGLIFGFAGLVALVGIESITGSSSLTSISMVLLASILYAYAVNMITQKLCTAVAFVIFFKVMDDIGPARASLVTYINTAFAVVLGVLILSEPLTLGIMVGLPMVLVGSYFASRKPSVTL